MTDSKPKLIPQYVASFTAAIGAFGLGAVIGWANVVQEEYEIGKTVFKTSKEEFSWIGSCFVLGAMCVCIPAGWFINLIGRKGTVIAMCIPCVIGWVMVIFAPNLYVLCVARFIIGFSAGSSCVSVPVYTTEIAEKSVRGFIGSLFQFMVVIGTLFAYSFGAILDARTLSTCCTIFPAICGLIMIFMPESPVYLIKKDMTEAASNSIIWLRGKDYDSKAEIEDIRAMDAYNKANPVSIVAAFKRAETQRAFAISIMLMLLQQISGINVVVFYSTDIFRDANTGINPDMSTAFIGVFQFIGSIFSMALIDRLGRKILLYISAAGMAICTGALGIYFYMKDFNPKLADSLVWLPVSSMCVFMLFFAIGYGPIPWLILGEIYSTDIKGAAGSLSATSNWLFAFILVKGFVFIRDLMTAGGVFVLFSVLTVLGILFAVFVVIETKGKSLGEIQAELLSLNKPKD